VSEKRPITVDDIYNIGHVEDPRISPDGAWIAYVKVTVDQFENTYKRNIWLAATDGGAPRQLTRGGKDSQPRWSPDGATLAFVSARDEKPQIYLLPTRVPGGEARVLTKAPNGATSPAWSPDGAHIAYLAPMREDERAKEDSDEDDPKPADSFEAKQHKERKAHDEEQYYDPRTMWRIPYRQGTSYVDERYAQIYVIAVDENLEGDDAKPRRLTDINADHDPPQWSTDGGTIYTSRTVDATLDEPWLHQHLYAIDVATGTHTQITTDATFTDYAPLPSPDGKWLAYVRTPLEHLAARNIRLTIIPVDGGEPRDLTLEFDRSVDDFKWAADSSALFFNAENWGDTEIYCVTLSDGYIEEAVAGRFNSEMLDVGVDGGIAYSASTAQNPGELYYKAADATEATQVSDVNGKFLSEVIVQEVHELRFKNPDGLELQGWYLEPVGYEAGKKYPLAFNIHGGPHAMWGPGTRSMWHEWQYHAAQGYAVFYSNPRGGEGYGEEFKLVLRKAWGSIAFTDLMAGVDAFLEKGIADENRMAVTGGSYGGYMTAWVVGHTDRFKSAVTQRGVYNLISFYGTTDVPFLIKSDFGVEPWEDIDFMWEQSPLAYAQHITTPLLIIHSDNDFRAPIPDAEQLFAFLRRMGKTVKMIRYPREGHELSRSGEPKHRVSRLTEMVNWFDEYCKP